MPNLWFDFSVNRNIYSLDVLSEFWVESVAFSESVFQESLMLNFSFVIEAPPLALPLPRCPPISKPPFSHSPGRPDTLPIPTMVDVPVAAGVPLACKGNVKFANHLLTWLNAYNLVSRKVHWMGWALGQGKGRKSLIFPSDVCSLSDRTRLIASAPFGVYTCAPRRSNGERREGWN